MQHQSPILGIFRLFIPSTKLIVCIQELSNQQIVLLFSINYILPLHSILLNYYIKYFQNNPSLQK